MHKVHVNEGKPARESQHATTAHSPRERVEVAVRNEIIDVQDGLLETFDHADQLVVEVVLVRVEEQLG